MATACLIAIGAFALIVLGSLAWFRWAIKRAPMGYQDQDGFHFGGPDDKH